MKTASGLLVIVLGCLVNLSASPAKGVKAAAGVAELVSDDSMATSGSIGPRYPKGQEGQLRASALVVQGAVTVCLVSCDVLVMPRSMLDESARAIAQRYPVPFENILISSTHTHSAPSTVRVHATPANDLFVDRLKEAIVTAAGRAFEKLEKSRVSDFYFAQGQEATVGHNSRWLLSDNTIYWVGPQDDVVRPTGPFDSDLPVLAFKSSEGKLEALLYNHSSHNIGGRSYKRSPGFYGLTAQEIEQELGGTCLFFSGAFGSTHVFNLPSVDERVFRLKAAIREAYAVAEKHDLSRMGSLKKEFEYKVRLFDEEKEEQAVSTYCKKRISTNPEQTIAVFREMRQELKPQQGQTRKTWLHAIRLGDVALVGLPGEAFTKLGIDIKRRSPFRYTYVFNLANDWIGYIPDSRAYELGGYQVWTGLHSYVARGTAEAMVDEAVRMLGQLKRD